MKTVENTHMPNSSGLQCIQILGVTRAVLFSKRGPAESGSWKALGEQWLDKGIRLEDTNGVWFGGDDEGEVSKPEDERAIFLRLREATRS
jgi:hypothetical protein